MWNPGETVEYKGTNEQWTICLDCGNFEKVPINLPSPYHNSWGCEVPWTARNFQWIKSLPSNGYIAINPSGQDAFTITPLF